MNRRIFLQYLVATTTLLTLSQREASQHALDGLHRDDQSTSPTLGGLLWIEAIPNSAALPPDPEEATAVFITETDEAVFFVKGPGWIILYALPPGACAYP